MASIMVVGGYGDVGKAAVTELLKLSTDQIVIGGRNSQKGQQFILQLDNPKLKFQLIDIYDKKTYKDKLLGVSTIIMCLSPKTVDFAAYCLRMGINYIDISASYQTTANLFHLDQTEINAVGLLGVGICPGLSTLLVKQLSNEFDTVEQIELTLLLGMGDHFGKDALIWLLDNLSQSFWWIVQGKFVKMKPFQLKKSICFEPKKRPLPAYTFNLADQQILAKNFSSSKVATYFTLDDRRILSILALLTKIHFFKLLRYPKVYRAVLYLFSLSNRFSKRSTSSFSFHVTLKGKKEGKSILSERILSGENSSETTGKLAAHSARLLQKKEVKNGLSDLSTYFELSDFQNYF